MELPDSDEEILARLGKRVERNDPKALINMAMYYGRGHLGLPVDQGKCIELLRESAGLGCPEAEYNLGQFHDAGAMGLEQNEEEALKCWEKAAECGVVDARHNLGCTAYENSEVVAAMRHLRLSAAGGVRASMIILIARFEEGFLHHGDLAETLQAMYRARAEMWSKNRVQHIAYLKMTGEYKEEYEC
jgi:TPR repeat protein